MGDRFLADQRDSTIPIIGFWRAEDEHGCFSNWYRAEFEYAGRRYTSIEQYMMFQKVSTFMKHDLAEAIMRTDDPAECKRIGRTKFPEFDSIVWDSVRKQIVKRGVKAKFRQNEAMLAELLSTEGSLLAECSPYDNVWGIGIGIDDDAWHNVAKWKGRNLLGRILMEVRDELSKERLLSRDGFIYIDNSYYASEIPEWCMRPCELNRIPQFHEAIHAYSDTLTDKHARDAFLHEFSLDTCERMMESNMGGGLPAAGFYEMKQDVYDTARYLRYRGISAGRLQAFCNRHIPMLRAISSVEELRDWCCGYPANYSSEGNDLLNAYVYNCFLRDAYETGLVIPHYYELLKHYGIKDWISRPTKELLEPLDAGHVQACISWHFRRDHFVEESLVSDSIAGGYMLLMLETLNEKLNRLL